MIKYNKIASNQCHVTNMVVVVSTSCYLSTLETNCECVIMHTHRMIIINAVHLGTFHNIHFFFIFFLLQKYRAFVYFSHNVCSFVSSFFSLFCHSKSDYIIFVARKQRMPLLIDFFRIYVQLRAMLCLPSSDKQTLTHTRTTVDHHHTTTFHHRDMCLYNNNILNESVLLRRRVPSILTKNITFRFSIVIVDCYY